MGLFAPRQKRGHQRAFEHRTIKVRQSCPSGLARPIARPLAALGEGQKSESARREAGSRRGLGAVKRDHMPYYLRIVTAAGTAAYVSTPCASVEAAMETASAVLRYGAIDAWVADENEKKVADFEAIKKHWAVGNP
jgi:hypothetical protein